MFFLVLYINVQTASYDPRSNMLSGSVWNEIFKNLNFFFMYLDCLNILILKLFF